MINRFVALLLFFSVGAAAQINTSSPYSFFGIGTTQFKGTVENRSMGGLSIYSDSIRVNLQNPAGLSRFKLLNFSVAGSYNYVDLQSESKSSIASSTAINYIALGIPLTEKLGVSFGLLPYTAVGYGLTSVSGQTVIFNSGEGGTNKVFLGAGYQVLPELSVGLEAAYNFGEIENITIFNQDNIQYGSKEVNRSTLSGFSYNLGVAYKKMISEKLELQSGATFGLESKLNSENF